MLREEVAPFQCIQVVVQWQYSVHRSAALVVLAGHPLPVLFGFEFVGRFLCLWCWKRQLVGFVALLDLVLGCCLQSGIGLVAVVGGKVLSLNQSLIKMQD